MANLVITSSANLVLVDFGVYASSTKIDKASFRRDEMSEIIEHFGKDFVSVIMLDGYEFDLSYDATDNAMKVDAVNGATPVDNDDLFDKLIVLQEI